MTNREISAVFRAIGALLNIRGDDAFRARIYERAADIISGFPHELEIPEDAEQNAASYNKKAVEQLRATPGIGKAIQDKTVEMLETGRCKYYDDLTAEMGTGVLDLLEIRGIGVKTASKFYHELGVRKLEDLHALLESGKLIGIHGFGEKTLEMISESLAFRMQLRNLRPLWMLLPIAEQISENLAQCIAPDGWIKRKPERTGHLRRHEETCQSIELIAECQDETVLRFENGIIPPPIQAFLEPFSQTEIVFKASDQIRYVYDSETASLTEKGRNAPTDDVRDTLPVIQFYIDPYFPVSIYLCTADTYELTLFLTTPADAHFEALPARPSAQTTKRGITEIEIYEELGLSYIPPELRQDATSVAAAKDDTLPKLIELADLRGDLHAHTDWSDGRHTIQEMVEAAKAKGLEYFAITDHSRSSAIANGLKGPRLLEQVQQVRDLNAQTEGITILAGSEVDILESGKLDFSNEVLAELDIVVASVHNHFALPETEMTQRLIRAIENPFVNIIGHPTGRMLGRRPMYALNIAEIIAAAAENNTVLEINGSPDRLDLNPEFVRMAKDAGVLLAVNTDAHGIRQLAHQHSGLNVARRGWLTKADVINTYTLEELHEQFGIGAPAKSP